MPVQTKKTYLIYTIILLIFILIIIGLFYLYKTSLTGEIDTSTPPNTQTLQSVEKPNIIYTKDSFIEPPTGFNTQEKEYTILDTDYVMTFEAPANWKKTGEVEFYNNNGSPFGFTAPYGFKISENPENYIYSHFRLHLYKNLQEPTTSSETIIINNKEFRKRNNVLVSNPRADGSGGLAMYDQILYYWKEGVLPDGYLLLSCTVGSENDKQNIEQVCRRFVETFEIKQVE